ncbi:cyclopropane-fatty-acyl-phospholipid synthase family protein [Vibrio sp. Isolate25]|uniref:SAM-dependent methyltransferase n=1 Tax=Vibrio TaxID=662 RepID=UPI001EFE03DB|nr:MULTISPECIES: cyclopropane-fatty-acyl-phospholipid synthase family protein [Vibrio]MCG9596825.1 cyclopropane-fatty-acyl-phospholipid synthase family protein [Vibrio sp. Isolate25]MCG9679762.1 cyclopropane-fatty-acyl-phospholipid synthase family protein [Vibrio sp. Isolate24]USD33460.1 class I SAM-dependent methyltransferase [Vibrio sp. SCSIO 43186]USD46529.1 class I SAM-dependent methyltransferase [Vibrio sp. SCSIO 43145]USD70584.1 class I SAM-dependent methyltransferase [Vibrio sp. SCSIO 4
MINSQTLGYSSSLSAGQKTARSLAMSFLKKITSGSLTVIESFSQSEVRATFGAAQTSRLHAVIEIKHPSFYARLLKGGSIAAGEAYMDGWWDSPDLTKLMELMALNLKTLDSIEGQSSFISRISYQLGHWFNRNTEKNAAKNISAHYDLSNELYETFLDKEMLYSAALFNSASDSLEQAQLNKMERLCQQLELTSSDRVIEIGTGWGGMAIYMAEKYGCHVTTTTISEQQYQYAQQKIIEKGLEHKITLLKQDYRQLKGHYDKLVSIEMIEAVGKEYLGSYIDKCQSLLRPQGLMAIQAITIADQRYDYYSNNVDFIQKYIFPGGFLPSITALTHATTTHSDLVLRNLFDIGLDYANTLKEWHARFVASERDVRQLGFDETFIRMWKYYFCYCEGGFRARSISTVHMTFQKA